MLEEQSNFAVPFPETFIRCFHNKYLTQMKPVPLRLANFVLLGNHFNSLFFKIILNNNNISFPTGNSNNF